MSDPVEVLRRLKDWICSAGTECDGQYEPPTAADAVNAIDAILAEREQLRARVAELEGVLDRIEKLAADHAASHPSAFFSAEFILTRVREERARLSGEPQPTLLDKLRSFMAAPEDKPRCPYCGLGREACSYGLPGDKYDCHRTGDSCKCGPQGQPQPTPGQCGDGCTGCVSCWPLPDLPSEPTPEPGR